MCNFSEIAEAVKVVKKNGLSKKEYKLIISPGIKINLEKEGLILVNGALIMRGEDE